ncbi:LacI family DNA-binding transcriptional regulator [Porticoccaceae bacterium]|nr:LacI family DNA-binding transcriptional regulator [Porticoccaceae bacterium]
MNANKNPTMYDVARVAGVSQKTVSRVFRKEPNVEEKTRDRILRAANQLGFSPNVAAQRLATKQSLVIALVFDARIRSVRTNSGFYLGLSQAALVKCHQQGYGLLLHSCDAEQASDRQAILQLCKGGSVDGLVLVSPLADSHALLELLDSNNIKYVECFSSRSAGAGVPYAVANDREGAKDLTRLLIKLGHRRIAFVQADHQAQSSQERTIGFQEAHAEAGITVDPDLITLGGFTFEAGLDCGEHLLSLERPPTAILAYNDDVASGILCIAHQKGIQVPNELSIAGFDDAGIAHQLWPPLTTVRQPIRDIATCCIDILLKLLRNEVNDNQSIVFPTTVMERGSTGPAPKQQN